MTVPEQPRHKMRLHDWSGFAALGALAMVLIEALRGNFVSALAWLLAVVILGALTRYWSVKHPAPMPHLLRWSLRIPRGNHSPAHLLRVLEPRPGEHILDVGPGIGIHALPVAEALAPDGKLDIFDVQQDMLDDVMRRAAESGIRNIEATRGNAERLPYPDASFDAAYLIGVLGEIPDSDAAVRELRRVLKPDGRLVIGEVCFDPDFVWFGPLRDQLDRASFAFERRLGGAFIYLARFRPK